MEEKAAADGNQPRISRQRAQWMVATRPGRCFCVYPRANDTDERDAVLAFCLEGKLCEVFPGNNWIFVANRSLPPYPLRGRLNPLLPGYRFQP